MKKLSYIIYTLILIISAGCTNTVKEETVQPANLEINTTVKGFYGDFDASIKIENDKITDVTVGENSETASVGQKAIEIMKKEIVEFNTVNVDIVTGATVTSSAFKNALQTALKENNVNEKFYAEASYETINETVDTDIVVVGAGAAGYAAAITAAENGKNVVLIEKQDLVGGSSLISAGIVYAALDENDIPAMEKYYNDRAENKANPDFVKYYAENSKENLDWLTSKGVEWMFTAPSGTALEPRANFAMNITGESLINPLIKAAEAAGVKTIVDCKAESLIKDGDKVVGVKATGSHGEYTINAKAVILATGGFDASEEMKAKYSPIAVGDFPLSNKGNTGDGINMGIDAGADTVFNGGIIGFVIVNGSLPYSGLSNAALNVPLYVSDDGEYLINGIDYPITYTAMKESEKNGFFAIYDADGTDNAMLAVDRNFGYKADTIEELASLTKMDENSLKDAISKVEGIDTAPYYAVTVVPSTIGSMGGLKINNDAEVLGTDGNPIKGLYAAGEVANADLYYIEYPASGTSNSMSFLFGRTAANSATKYIGE